MLRKRKSIRFIMVVMVALAAFLGIPYSQALPVEKVSAERLALDKFGKVEIYDWKRLYGANLPSGNFHGMIAWSPYWDPDIGEDDYGRDRYNENAQGYYLNAATRSGTISDGKIKALLPSGSSDWMLGGRTTSATMNSFRTLGCMGTPYFRYTDKDTDNEDAPMYYIEECRVGCTPESRGSGWRLGFPDGRDQLQWTTSRTYTNYKKTPYQWSIYSVVGYHDVRYGYHKIFLNLPDEYDPGLQLTNENLFCATSGGGWGSYVQVRFYYGVPKTYDTIGADYTVQSGQTLNIDANLFLPDNITLTIEEGAVASIEGQFYNNGTIINKGTLVVQPGSRIESFDPIKREDSISSEGKKLYRPNTIICDGGDIVMMGESKMVFSRYDGGLTLQNGATMVNNGMVVTDTATRLMNSTIDNRKLGEIYQGVGMQKGVVASDLRSSPTSNPIEISNTQIWNDPKYSGAFQGGGFRKYGLTVGGGSLIENKGLFMQISLARANTQSDPWVTQENGRTYHDNTRVAASERAISYYSGGKTEFLNSNIDLFPNDSQWRYVKLGENRAFKPQAE